MKLDSMGKRIGLLMVMAALLIFICLFLLSLIIDFQGIDFISSAAQPSAKSRGYMNALLHEWIGVSLVVFPLFLCGIVLLFGYGEKIIHWIRFGAGE